MPTIKLKMQLVDRLHKETSTHTNTYVTNRKKIKNSVKENLVKQNQKLKEKLIERINKEKLSIKSIESRLYKIKEDNQKSNNIVKEWIKRLPESTEKTAETNHEKIMKLINNIMLHNPKYSIKILKEYTLETIKHIQEILIYKQHDTNYLKFQTELISELNKIEEIQKTRSDWNNSLIKNK